MDCIKMSALSFWQPYAWFIVNGFADFDSRHWSPPSSKLGVPIAVHASKRKVTRPEFEDFLDIVKKLKIKKYPMSPNDFDYGAVVGTVVVADVIKNAKSIFAIPGYYHWRLKDARAVPMQKIRGRMGWFTVDINQNNLERT